MTDDHRVGLRELRHRTGAVLARVRAGETLDVTEHGRPIARLVPVHDPVPSPLLARLEREGRLIPATRPGYLPAHRVPLPGKSASEALAEMRDEERW